GDVREDPPPGSRGHSPADHGQHATGIGGVERMGEGEGDALERACVEVCGGGGGVEAEHGTQHVLVPDGVAFPAEAGQDQQSRRPATALALALLEETVGAADVGAGEICAACPCGGGSGGEERGDVQLADTGEGEAVRGAVDQDALRSGADARDPAAGAEGGVVLARIGPRSEEHTSELQSRFDLVCRLLLEKKKEEKAL